MNDTSNRQHPDLDLRGRIRPGLDTLANVIVIALKTRMRFLRNTAIYKPGLVLTDGDATLLDYELGRIEHCHAELGRYTFADQESFTDVSGVAPVINRQTPPSPVRSMSSNVGGRIVDFYRQWIELACEDGEDASTYGETVTADVDALLAIMERVNLGKLVAESKFAEATAGFLDTQGDRDAMLELIVRKDREAKVFELAELLAQHYEVDVDHTVRVFQFMIATTIDIEVDYLRLRIAEVSGKETDR